MKKILLLLSCLYLFSCTKNREVTITPIGDSIKADTQISLPDNLSAEPLEGEILLHQNANPAFKNRLWQGIPSVTVAPNGTMYVAWYSGAKGEEPGNYITVSVSTDNGKTWINDEMVINPTNQDVRYFDPALWTDKFGNVFLSWSKSRKLLWDGIGGVWYTKLNYAAGQIAFTPAKRFADGVMMCRPTDNYDKTATLYPIAVWKTATTDNGVYIYKSIYNNNIQRSYYFRQLSKVPFNKSLRSYDEHQVIQLKDRSYYVLLRGVDGLYFTRSDNARGNWSEVKKFTDIETTSSRFFLGRLKSGKIALILNNSTNRSNLKIYLSDDEMKTWKYSMQLDVKFGISYPDMVEGEDGKLYVVYDYDRFGNMAINSISFNEQDVINNNPKNISRTIISAK